jgi:hypothetical protein
MNLLLVERLQSLIVTNALLLYPLLSIPYPLKCVLSNNNCKGDAIWEHVNFVRTNELNNHVFPNTDKNSGLVLP